MPELPPKSEGNDRLVVAHAGITRDDIPWSGLAAEWQVEVVADAAGLMEAIRTSPAGLILIDMALAGPDGAEGDSLLAALRRITSKDETPVVLLVDREEISTAIAALEEGADDFLVKPFLAEELAARARLVRRCSQSQSVKREESTRESAERFRRLVQVDAQAVWETNPSGVVITGSPSWRSYTGQTFEETMGHGWADVIHPDDREKMELQWQWAVEAGLDFNAEHRMRAADGSYRWTNARATAIRDSSGNILKWAGMNVDIHNRKLAEAAVQESEERLRAFINATSDIVYLASADWTEMINLSGKNMVEDTDEPRIDWIRDYIPEVDQPLVREAIARAVESKKHFQIEHRVIQADGKEGWVSSRAQPLLDAQGGIKAWFGAAADITHRKNYQRRQEFLLKLSDTMRPLLDPAEIQMATTTALGEFLRATRVQYHEVEANGEWLSSNGGFADGVPLVTERLRMDDFGPHMKEAYRAGTTVVVTDVFKDPLLTPEKFLSYDALGLRSFIGIPLVKAGRFVAVMGVHDDSPREWTEEEISLAEETAERTWAAIERASAEAALRVSEADYRSLFNSINEGFCTIEMIFDENERCVDYRFLQVNEAFQQQTGLTDVIGKSVCELLPEHEERWLEIYGRVALTGEGAHIEDYAKALDRIYDVSAFRFGDPSHRAVAVLFNDITERKRHAQRQEFFLTLSDVLRPLADPAEIQSAATQVLGRYLGLCRCQYYETDDNGETVISAGGYADGVDLLTTRVSMKNYGDYVRDSCRNGETVVVTDISTDPRISAEDRAAYLSRGYRSYVAVSLVKNGRWVATLGAQHANPHQWTDHEISLVADTAERTWAAIARSQAEEALRNSEDKYRTLFNSMDEGYCIIQMVYDEQGTPVDWRFLETNPAFHKQNGMPECTGKTMREMVPDIEQKWMDTYNSVVMTGRSLRFEESSPAMQRVFDLYAFRVGDPEERKLAVLFMDITKRRQSEENVRASEERLRIALESAEMAAWDWTVAEDRVLWNERHYLILGEVPGTGVESSERFFEFVHPLEREALGIELHQSVESGQPFQADFRIIRADTGEVRWMTGYGRPLEMQDGRATRMTGVMYDCTARRMMTEELKRAHDRLEIRVRERTEALAGALADLTVEAAGRKHLEQERKQLIERLVASQEDERSRISRELHDNLSQHMVRAKMELGILKQDLEEISVEEQAQLADSLRNLTEGVDSLIAAAHREAWELRPPELDHLGLEVALDHYTSVWAERSGLSMELDASGWNGLRLSQSEEINLYRVVQEALANVTRHSKATKARVSLRAGNPVIVTIEDDGVGFAPDKMEGRLGIIGMRERVALLGGTLNIDSMSGRGTRVIAKLKEEK